MFMSSEKASGRLVRSNLKGVAFHLSKPVITNFTVQRHGGGMINRHTDMKPWGGLRAALGRFYVGCSKVLDGNAWSRKVNTNRLSSPFFAFKIHYKEERR